jgi:2-iminobutanoate/2-iminopropanoate deaminase
VPQSFARRNDARPREAAFLRADHGCTCRRGYHLCGGSFGEGGVAVGVQALGKDVKTLGMPWEDEYGYSQAVKVGDTIYVAGQVSHDSDGRILGVGDMVTQMREAYANMQKVLAQYGATMDNLVDEILFVTDMEAAFDAAVKVRRDVFAGFPRVASTIVEIGRLAFPELMIEIKGVAKV